jgi:glutamate---cysteine ligase / carboxylate-amine ligase
MDFKSSDPMGMGIEMEFQLLDVDTLALVNGIIPLMELYPNNPYVKPEFIQNTVEIASKVCYSVQELHEHVSEILVDLRVKCGDLGMELCGSGTHPFDKNLATITPSERYLGIERESEYISHNQITFATHVHIGMSSAEEAIRVMRELKIYLPLLVALSANSPFWRGYDTGFASYRHIILAASRSYGLPPDFDNWAGFEQFVDATQRAGIFKTINDIHWDIRPRPHLGTIEVRVMDVQQSVEQSVALAAFVRTLVFYVQSTTTETERRKPASWWIQNSNHYEASKCGMDAKLLSDELGHVEEMRSWFQETIDKIESTAAGFNQDYYLQLIKNNVKNGPGYVRQRAAYQNQSSLNDVVKSLVGELENREEP